MSYVALLRGINLGKINKVEMKTLRTFFEELGYQNVRTHIQTGNVLFDEMILNESQLEMALEQRFGFSIPVTVRSKKQLLHVQQHSLFTQENVYVIFLTKPITEEGHLLLQKLVTEKLEMVDMQTLVIQLSTSFHQTKFNNSFFERTLRNPSTIRNRNTVEKIYAKM